MAEVKMPYSPATAKQFRREDGCLDLRAFAASQGVTLPDAMVAPDDDDGGDDDYEASQPAAAASVADTPEVPAGQGRAEALATLGLQYVIGDGQVCASMARLLLLQQLGSVYLAGPEAGTVQPTLIETARALFILARGPACTVRLMAAEQMEERLEKLEHLGDKSPEHLQAYLACVERCCLARAEWDREALQWFERHTDGLHYQELVDEVAGVIRAGVNALAQIRDGSL